MQLKAQVPQVRYYIRTPVLLQRLLQFMASQMPAWLACMVIVLVALYRKKRGIARLFPNAE